jgi:hypothetical protein
MKKLTKRYDDNKLTINSNNFNIFDFIYKYFLNKKL